MEHAPLNPALRSLKQENYGLEGSQFCTEIPVSKKKKKLGSLHLFWVYTSKWSRKPWLVYNLWECPQELPFSVPIFWCPHVSHWQFLPLWFVPTLFTSTTLLNPPSAFPCTPLITSVFLPSHLFQKPVPHWPREVHRWSKITWLLFRTCSVVLPLRPLFKLLCVC